MKINENIKQYAKHLICGSCGQYFKMWEGYIDQDQDKGFGICSRCQGEADIKEQVAFNKACMLVIGALKKYENREQFINMSKEEKYYVIHKLFESGTLKWKIGK